MLTLVITLREFLTRGKYYSSVATLHTRVAVFLSNCAQAVPLLLLGPLLLRVPAHLFLVLIDVPINVRLIPLPHALKAIVGRGAKFRWGELLRRAELRGSRPNA